jgi:hypothetical protein
MHRRSVIEEVERGSTMSMLGTPKAEEFFFLFLE